MRALGEISQSHTRILYDTAWQQSFRGATTETESSWWLPGTGVGGGQLFKGVQSFSFLR